MIHFPAVVCTSWSSTHPVSFRLGVASYSDTDQRRVVAPQIRVPGGSWLKPSADFRSIRQRAVDDAQASGYSHRVREIHHHTLAKPFCDVFD
jgi:hypothetical protein